MRIRLFRCVYFRGQDDDAADDGLSCALTSCPAVRAQTEIGALRDDFAPALMRGPQSLEETVQRYVRPGLRDVAVNLCRQPVSNYLERFNFRR